MKSFKYSRAANLLYRPPFFIFQAAYQAGEEEVSLSTRGRSYLLDFNSMQQINEDTGTARPVVRKLSCPGLPGHNSAAGGDPGNCYSISSCTFTRLWFSSFSRMSNVILSVSNYDMLAWNSNVCNL